MTRTLNAALLTLVLAAGLVATPAMAGHGHGKSHNAHSNHQRPDHARKGELSIQNRSGQVLALYANGNFVANIGQGWQSVSLPYGSYKLRLERSNHKVASTQVSVSSHHDPVWRVDAPAMGRLVIKNPLPVAVYVNGPGTKDQRIAPGAKASFNNLTVGWNQFQVRTVGGRQLDSIRVNIDPWEKEKRQVHAPSTGFVMVDNREGLALGIYVNGRRVGQVAAYSREAVELPLGSARVDLVDERGQYRHTLSTQQVHVQAWDEALVRLDIAGQHQRPSGTASVSIHVRR